MRSVLKFFKESKYRIFLLIYTLVLAILLVVFFVNFSKFLERYEELKPEKVITEFIDGKSSDYWDGLIEERYEQKVTVFENVDTVIDKLKLKDVDTSKLTFHKRIKDYTDEKPAYTVYYSNKELASVSLRAEEKYSFGLVKWAVDDVELTLNDGGVNSVAVGVTVPPEAIVKVNGVQLDEKYITEKKVVYDDVNEFEKEKEGVPYRVKYKVDKLFDLPEVKAFNADGSEAELSIKSYEYSLIHPNTDKKKVSVTVPTGYSVTLNGVKVDSKYMVKADIPHSLMVDVKGYNGEIPTLCEYVIEGLYVDPEIKVFDKEGKEVPLKTQDKNAFGYDIQADENAKNTHQGVVDSFIRAYFKYTADGSRNINANYNNLLSKALWGSSAYTVIQGSYNGVIWNDTHNITYNKLEYKNFVMHGNDCFSCEVEYDADFTLYIYNTHYAGTFKLVFVRDGNTFKLSKFLSE